MAETVLDDPKYFPGCCTMAEIVRPKYFPKYCAMTENVIDKPNISFSIIQWLKHSVAVK